MDISITESRRVVIGYALARFASDARRQANSIASKVHNYSGEISSYMKDVDEAGVLLRDARDAEAVLALLRNKE